MLSEVLQIFSRSFDMIYIKYIFFLVPNHSRIISNMEDISGSSQWSFPKASLKMIVKIKNYCFKGCRKSLKSSEIFESVLDILNMRF